MKEKLYTIPINEAMEKNGECLFCTLYDDLELKALEYTLGPSYMEPDVRIKTNKMGFCKEHYVKMYRMNNRLGLSLIMESHLEEILSGYERFYNQQFFKKKGIFHKSNNEKQSPVKKMIDSCYICDKINHDMDNFFDTFIFMWRKDKSFREKFIHEKSFCLAHFDLIAEKAYKKMSLSEFSDFFEILLKKQKEDILAVKNDLEWFIKKFDCRFKDEPWKNSKDALKRCILKAASVDPDKD